MSSVPPSTAPPRRQRHVATSGFTLVELMVVVVIIGVLSAIALPYIARDRRSAHGGQFARGIMRELQIARLTAINERLPVRAFVYNDRVELRQAIAGARPGEAPRPPTTADPLLRRVDAPTGVVIFEIGPSAVAPVQPVLPDGNFVAVDFSTRGQAQLVGAAPLTPFFMFMRNQGVAQAHPDAHYRMDVVPLTADLTLRTEWP